MRAAAYNMEDESGATGDFWMQQIQPIATKVPYLFVVGNHEEADNFSQPLHRFSSHNHLGTNSGSDTMLWYSVNIGFMHYVGISTEVSYPRGGGTPALTLRGCPRRHCS
jgi:hypothetical protein